MRRIVALTGPRGSGKTTVATLLASTLNWPQRSFGDLVRKVAVERGVSSDVGALSVLGASLVEEWGWDRIIEELLVGCDSDVVMEGIRHVAALTKLRLRGEVLLVFVDTPEIVRTSRIRNRARPGDSEQGPTELEYENLRAASDLKVDGTDCTLAAAAVADILGKNTN